MQPHHMIQRVCMQWQGSRRLRYDRIDISGVLSSSLKRNPNCQHCGFVGIEIVSHIMDDYQVAFVICGPAERADPS
jgi:hypothetical protein